MTTMQATSKIQALADLFETKKRDDGSTFVAFKDEAPEWTSDFAREAHGTDMLPDDFRYQVILEALEFIAEREKADEDDASEFADDVDVYTSDLLAWVSSHLARQGYVDEAQEQGLVEPDTTLDRRLMVGQYLERQEVFGLVVAALETFEDEIAEL